MQWKKTHQQKHRQHVLVCHFKVIDVWFARTLSCSRGIASWLRITVYLCTVLRSFSCRPAISHSIIVIIIIIKKLRRSMLKVT